MTMSRVLHDRAPEHACEAARHGRGVALDDDVEIALADRRAAPQVTDEAPHEIRAAVVLLRDPPDGLEELPDIARQAPADAAGGRRLGHAEAGEWATDGTPDAPRASHRDEWSAGREQTAHDRLAGAWIDGWQHARDLHGA